VNPLRSPDFNGRSLVNLIATLEKRMTGTAQAPELDHGLAEYIPEAATYVFCLFDGLGDSMLDHPAARELASARVASITGATRIDRLSALSAGDQWSCEHPEVDPSIGRTRHDRP
jgi:hypothetical protein